MSLRFGEPRSGQHGQTDSFTLRPDNEICYI